MMQNSYMKLETFKLKIYWKFFEKPMAALFYYLPIKKNRIIFDNFGGKGFGGNPKFVAEALHEKKQNLEMIWLVENHQDFTLPQYIKPIKIDSLKALYMRATSSVWIDNIRHRHPVKKKKNQIYLQTWHGTMSAKKVEKDAENLLDKTYVKKAKYDGEITDAIIADNKLQEQIYKRAFWLNKNAEILQIGFPQNDQTKFVDDNIFIINRLKKEMKFDNNTHYILYAPTFRDDYSIKGYELDFKKIIETFENKIGKKVKIIVRLHPNAAFQKSKIHFSDNIIDGTDYSNIQDLEIVSESVISDYSSTLFDFAMMKKPAFVCALDYEEYESKRGFIPEFFEFPFPIAKSNEELIEVINKFELESYVDKVNAFYQKYPTYGDGHASEKAAEWILNHLN